MVLFKTKSKSKSASIILKYSWGTCPRTRNISVADITIYFHMKVAIFYSKFIQNIKQNASTVASLKNIIGS